MLSRFAAVVFLYLLSTVALSQDQSPATQQDDDHKSPYTQAGNVPGRFGVGDGQENIDTFSGLLQLTYIDAVIPGEGGFDLPIIRRYSNKQAQNSDSTNRVFGTRWDMHFGRIQSNVVSGLSFCPDSFWFNDKWAPVFQDANGTSHTMYTARSDFEGAADAVTRERHRITCSPNSDNDILIEAPNGMKYIFGKQRYRQNGNGLPYSEFQLNNDLPVIYRNYRYVTRIEDRSGNGFDINYTMQNSSNGFALENVFTIDSVDGSSISATFEYKPAPGEATTNSDLTPNVVLASLEVGTKIVEYEYESVFDGDTAKRYLSNNLTNVSTTAGPDRQTLNWEYGYYADDEPTEPGAWAEAANDGNLKTMTNRFGGVTEYTYQWIQSPDSVRWKGIRAIATKTSAGLGTWTFDFDEGAVGDGFDRTTVSGPENIVTKYKYCNLKLTSSECNDQMGRLVEQIVEQDGNEIETNTFLWRSITSVNITDQYELVYTPGFIEPTLVNIEVDPRVLVHTTTERDGEYLSVSRFYDGFANPNVILEASTQVLMPYGDITGDGVVDIAPGEQFDISATGMVNPLFDPDAPALDSDKENFRVTSIVYENKTGDEHWVLGLPKTYRLRDKRDEVASEPVSQKDQLIEYTYYSNGDVKTHSQYGALTQYFYDAKGNVERVIDPNGNIMKSEDFVLGVAQTESRSMDLGAAPKTYMTRVVNPETGLVDSQTSFRDIANNESYTTEFKYDNLGRVEKVLTARPDDADIDIVYETNKTTTTRGARVSVDTYDQYGRTKNIRLSGGGVTQNIDSDYDAYGRVSYRSLPFKDGEATVGTNYKYDAINRILSETSTVDGLAISYDYDGLKTSVTDRNNETTTMSYRAYGSFSDTQLMLITQPTDDGRTVETAITRTKTGLPITVSQNNVTRTYKYDGRYRLKRKIRPETADVVFTYDDNKNLRTKRIVGFGEIALGYDGRNNLITADYPTGNVLNSQFLAKNVVNTYYDDSTPRTSTKGRTKWEFKYDENNNVKTETLTVDGVGAFELGRTYDSLDSLSTFTYPTGSQIDFNPDVLGRPTTVGSFLLSVDYTATSVVDSATYGNGLSWSMGVNDHKIVSSNNVPGVFEESFLYDGNFNVRTYTSNIDLNRAFEYKYDGMNRVDSMSSTNSLGERYFLYDDNSNAKTIPLLELGFNDEMIADFDQAGSDITLDNVSRMKDISIEYDSAVTHDAYGNVSAYRGYEFQFDDAGLLRRMENSGVEVSSFQYDAGGSRTLIDRDGQEIVTVYSGGQLVHESNSAEGLTSDFMYLNNYLVAREDTQDESVDTDGDGIPNLVEGRGDTDGDGVADYLDLDSDGDGIPDASETADDDDGDGLPNYIDTDSNNNGILDLDENLPPQDHCAEYLNYDTVTGFVSVSVSENGVIVQRNYTDVDAFSPEADLDGDGIANLNDPDIDGDQSSEATVFGSNAWERDDQYVADIDCDGIPNWYDLDSDSDGLPDSAELPIFTLTEKDDDGDGVPNVYEQDSDGDDAIDFKSLNTRLPYFATTLDVDGNPVIEGTPAFRLGIGGQSFVLSADNLATIGAMTTPTVSYRFESDKLELVPSSQATDYATCNQGAGIYSMPVTFSGSGVQGTGTEIIEGNSIGYTEQELADAVSFLTRPYQTTTRCIADPGLQQPGTSQYRTVYEIENWRFELEDFPNDLSTDWIMEITSRYNPSFDSAGTIRFVQPYQGNHLDLATGQPVVYTPLVLQYVSDPEFLPRVPAFGSCFGDTSIQDAELCNFNSSPNLNNTAGKLHIANFRSITDPVIGDFEMSLDFDAYGYQILNWSSVYDMSGAFVDGDVARDIIFEIANPVAGGAYGDLGSARFLASPNDADSDGDGILDIIEKGSGLFPRDSDADGVPDYLDLDSDNDRIPDQLEALSDALQPRDTDGNGAPDYLDIDSDNDGIEDGLETIADADNDGIPNFLDDDSDGDNIPDRVEASSASAFEDLDGDGIPNYLDEDADGDSLTDFFESGGGGETPTDSDADGIPDYLDTDSDNDGIPDSEDENSNGGITDTDQDGLPDSYEAQYGLDSSDPADAASDTDADGLSALDEYALGTNPTLADTDADGVPDGYEVAANTDPLVDDGSEDANGNGISNLDEYLQSLPLDTDGDGINDDVDLDDDNDGQSDADEIACGSDPLDMDSVSPDSNSDGLPDCVSPDNVVACGGYQVTEDSPGNYSASGFNGNVIVGTADSDILNGSAEADLILGLAGEDTINGNGGADVICGGLDADIIRGNVGADQLFGGGGADELHGGRGADELHGGRGTDELRGGRGTDKVHGGRGRDLIYGGDGADELRGGRGQDVIYGGAGADMLNGGRGDDELRGGAGEDELYGGADTDQLYGGAGTDYCVGGAGVGDQLNGCEGGSQ